jgi:hypothetical protein
MAMISPSNILTAAERRIDLEIAEAQEADALPDWMSGRYSIEAYEADRYYGGERDGR